MNDELQLTEEDLESMADKLIEEAAGADIAGQQETELIKSRKKSSRKKEGPVDTRPPEVRLQELFEKGKKARDFFEGPKFPANISIIRTYADNAPLEFRSKLHELYPKMFPKY